MDSLIFFIVECVAIPIHWMVEKCEVPMEEEDGSEGAVLGPPPTTCALEQKSEWAVLTAPTLFCEQWMIERTHFPQLFSHE